MFKDGHIEKFKRFMRHIKLISMNKSSFWIYLKVLEVVQDAVPVHHDHHVSHVQGQAHGEVEEDHEAHEQEIVLDALKSA
jgi:hypothetical protein